MISGTSSRRHSDRDRIILWRAPPAQGAGATFGIATDEPLENKRLVLRDPNRMTNSGTSFDVEMGVARKDRTHGQTLTTR